MAEPSTRLLLLHGAGLGGWIWDRVTPHLTESAEAVDLPGRTDGTNPGTVTLKHCIDFVAVESPRRERVEGVGQRGAAAYLSGTLQQFGSAVWTEGRPLSRESGSKGLRSQRSLTDIQPHFVPSPWRSCWKRNCRDVVIARREAAMISRRST